MDDSIKVYAKIAEILSAAIPEPWTTATTRVELGDHSSEHVSIYFTPEGRRGQVFVDDEVDPIVCKLQEDMASQRVDKVKWYAFEFKLEPSGKFSVDFDYEKPQWIAESEELDKKKMRANSQSKHARRGQIPS